MKLAQNRSIIDSPMRPSSRHEGVKSSIDNKRGQGAGLMLPNEVAVTDYVSRKNGSKAALHRGSPLGRRLIQVNLLIR